MSRPLILCLIVAAIAQPSDPVKKHIEIIQGEWKVQWLEQDGKKVEVRERVCVFRGNKCEWRLIGDGAKPTEKSSFEIDPTCTPKIIDYISSAPDNKVSKKEGIYKIDGDTMIWCMNVAEGVKNRPLDFQTKEGSNCLVIWFTRNKPDKKKEN
jgi:uncharacterized protein (TIGR03067 family)